MNLLPSVSEAAEARAGTPRPVCKTKRNTSALFVRLNATFVRQNATPLQNPPQKTKVLRLLLQLTTLLSVTRGKSLFFRKLVRFSPFRI
jgi:hypothetical protein